MAGFRYLTGDASSINRFRQYLSLAGNERRSRGGTVDIEAGFTGAITVTDVGFEPEALFIMGAHILGSDHRDEGHHHWGFADGANQWGGGVFYGYLGDSRHSRWSDSLILAAANGGIEGSLVSFDSDGFELDIDVGPPNDSTITYLAIRGQGSYHVGTATSPTTLGAQAITGLGFEPTAIFLSSAMRFDLTPGDGLSDIGTRAYVCHGVGNLEDGQYNVWAGSDAGDVYTSQAAQDGAVLSLWQDANIASPYQPLIRAEATLDSLDADGFTLDWTTVDATEEYYFSWFAAEDYSQIGRWTYNHPSGVRGRVNTRKKPKALIFPSNAMAVNGSHGQGTSGGATLGLGWCDQRGARGGNQWNTSFQDLDAPTFFVPRAGSDLRACAFGAYNRHDGGATLVDHQEDWGIVTPFGRDHLLRLHVGQ